MTGGILAQLAQQAITNHTRTLAAIVRFAGGLDTEQQRELLSIAERGIEAQSADRRALYQCEAELIALGEPRCHHCGVYQRGALLYSCSNTTGHTFTAQVGGMP